MRELLAHGEIVVVETDDEQFLGTCEIHDGHAIVRSGYVGRPVMIALDEVEAITPADLHPDVVSPDGR